MSQPHEVNESSNAALTTVLSGSMGGVALMVISHIRASKLDVLGLANGSLAGVCCTQPCTREGWWERRLLSLHTRGVHREAPAEPARVSRTGLVAITAGADVIEPKLSLMVGASAGIVYWLASQAVEAMHVDDVVDAVAVHGACGFYGVVSVGLFHHQRGLFTSGDGGQLVSQLLGGVSIFGLSLCVGVPAWLLRRSGLLRLPLKEEEAGLDNRFGLHAYERHADFLTRHQAMAAQYPWENDRTHIARTSPSHIAITSPSHIAST